MIVSDGVLVVSKAKGSGNIETRRTFRNFQLHIEWKIPEDVTGTDQERGNSGIFLAGTGPGDAGYELQILDSYENKTYANGQAGSIYKQGIPLVNPARKPGEWQSYDVVWKAPVFNPDGSVKTPAVVTVLFNGVLVQDHFELSGETLFIGKPVYKKYDSAPIKLQAHPTPVRRLVSGISGSGNSIRSRRAQGAHRNPYCRRPVQTGCRNRAALLQDRKRLRRPPNHGSPTGAGLWHVKRAKSGG